MISRCARYIIIWSKPDGFLYHRFVSGHYCDYFVGYVNNYGHTIIYICDVSQYKLIKPPFKSRVKRKLIKYIEKM